MKVIKQFFEVLHDSPDLVKDIGTRSRICYKSEDKAKESEAGFVKGIIKSGHNSCLEMGAVTLFFTYMPPGYLADLTTSKYLICDGTEHGLFVTGTVRAWREWLQVWRTGELVNAIGTALHNREPVLFEDLYTSLNWENPGGVISIPTTDEPIPLHLTKRHTFQGVKFTTNRAVTHEIVRHRPVTYLQESQRYCAYNKDQFDGNVTFIEPTAFNFDEVEMTAWRDAMKYTEEQYLWMLEHGQSAQAARTMLPNSCKTEIIVYCSLQQWEHIFAMRCHKAAEPSMQEAMYPVLADFQVRWPGFFNLPERSVG